MYLLQVLFVCLYHMKWIHSDGEQRKIPIKALPNTILSLSISILPNSLRKLMEFRSFEKIKSISCSTLCNTFVPSLPEALRSGFTDRHINHQSSILQILIKFHVQVVWLSGHNLSAAHCMIEKGPLAPGLAIDNGQSRFKGLEGLGGLEDSVDSMVCPFCRQNCR